jgi:hypothetical protein
MKSISKIILLFVLILLITQPFEMAHPQEPEREIMIFRFKPLQKNTSIQYWEPLEEAFSNLVIVGLFTDEFENFRKSNWQNPTVVRNIIFLPEPGDNPSRGNVIQIFESESSARDFSELSQPFRNPRWAQGVIGVIESMRDPSQGYSQVVSAQKLVLNPKTNQGEVQNIRIRKMVNYVEMNPKGFYTLGPGR